MSTATETTLLRVLSCRKRSAGKRKGAAWTLFELDVRDESGEALELPCFSFFACRRGLREFEIERRNHPTYGPSYTLTPLDGADGSELLERLEALEAQVATLAAAVHELRGTGELDAEFDRIVGAQS